MSLSIAKADETTKVTFRLTYQDPAEGGPDDAPEHEAEFATEAGAEDWVDEACVVGLRIDLVERVYNRWGSIVFTYIDSGRYDAVRGYCRGLAARRPGCLLPCASGRPHDLPPRPPR